MTEQAYRGLTDHRIPLPWPVYRPCRCCNAQCAWLAPTCPYVPEEHRRGGTEGSGTPAGCALDMVVLPPIQWYYHLDGERDMDTHATDFSQYLITCEHKDCTMRFFYLPEHEAANRPRLCGDHMAEHMRYERGMQGHPNWSVD